MLRLFFIPEWFSHFDLIFNLVGLLSAFLIAAYSWRVYRINQENKFAYFSFAFLLVALSFFFQFFTGSVLNITPVRETVADFLRPVAGLSASIIYYRAAFFLQMFAMLSAWLLIFFISQKSRARLKQFYEVAQIALFLYLVFLISILSNFIYSIFYTTSAVLLGLITLNYYKNYLNRNKNIPAYLVMFSFLLILFGNISLAFVFLTENFYILGEVLILLGFLLILYTYQKITRR